MSTTALDAAYFVRIVYTLRGTRYHDFIGPMDRWLADVTCQTMAHLGWHVGLEWVHVERALIVPASEVPA